MNITQLEKNIFNTNIAFENKAIDVYNYQYNNINIYQNYCNHLGKTPHSVNKLNEIPFLPIEFFKSHSIIKNINRLEKIFRSSGTTGQTTSQHYIQDLKIYEKSILNGFRENYGNLEDYCILGLLPSYLEREDASLVYMVDYLMKKSNHISNGFYLDNFSDLASKLTNLILNEQPTILIGVTFALLDFAEQFPMNLQDVVIMETGGMKGRRKELTRNVLHDKLKSAFKVELIHSEYGMTELLSQSYFQKSGHFKPSSTMKFFCRDIYDPFSYVPNGITGALNIIDLANLHSCAFIETQDIGKVYDNGEFDVLGRTNASDLRGCNLMVL